MPSLRRQIVSSKVRAYLQANDFIRVEIIISQLLKRSDSSDLVIAALIQIDLTCLDFGFIPNKHKEIFDKTIMAADCKFAKDEMSKTIQLLTSASAIGFHTLIHLSTTTSPLVRSSSGYLDVWHTSESVARLHSSPLKKSIKRESESSADSQIKFYTYANSNFLPLLIEQEKLENGNHPELIDFADEAFRYLRLPLSKQVQHSFDHGFSQSEIDQPPVTSKVEFVEWGLRAAVFRSRMNKPSGKRIIRIHSYEPFTIFPQLICADGVDLLIFVSEFTRKLTFQVAPHLQAIESVVIPNAIDLSSFNTNKRGNFSKAIAVLGYASTAKDPLWALEVIEELNKIQTGWKLILAGGDFPTTNKPSENKYEIEFRKRLSLLGDQIQLVPFQENVKDFLQDVGVILSSSIRESFHIAVAEGVASGCLPVVRNWPYFQEFDGARSIYPNEWVVETAREAAQRIATNSELTPKQREDIRSEIISMYDWSSVKKKYHDAIWS